MPLIGGEYETNQAAITHGRERFATNLAVAPLGAHL